VQPCSGNPAPPEEDRELAHLVAATRGIQPWRRVFHAATGVVTALVLHFLLPERGWALLALGGLLAVLLLLDGVRLRYPPANRAFFRLFRGLASPREERSVASSTWYMVGILIAVALFPMTLVIPGVLVLAVADPAASVLGRAWGRRRLGTGSVEGTAVFVVVAFLVLLPFTGPGIALGAAVVAAAVEILPTGLDDNLTIPLATACALALLGG